LTSATLGLIFGNQAAKIIQGRGRSILGEAAESAFAKIKNFVADHAAGFAGAVCDKVASLSWSAASGLMDAATSKASRGTASSSLDLNVRLPNGSWTRFRY
jgi:hypothetical protein